MNDESRDRIVRELLWSVLDLPLPQLGQFVEDYGTMLAEQCSDVDLKDVDTFAREMPALINRLQQRFASVPSCRVRLEAALVGRPLPILIAHMKVVAPRVPTAARGDWSASISEIENIERAIHAIVCLAAGVQGT